jgi:type IV secretion system protein VirB10
MGLASAQDAEARSSGTLVLNAGESGLANQAQSVGSRIANRDLGRQPTLQIRQGAEVRLLVDKDLILEPYH